MAGDHVQQTDRDEERVLPDRQKRDRTPRIFVGTGDSLVQYRRPSEESKSEIDSIRALKTDKC